MDKNEYLKIVKKFTPHEDNQKDYILAFISGGAIGMTGEIIRLFLINNYHISKPDATSYVILIAIFVSALLTCIGKFDTIIEKFKSGIIIPITGFAHSVTSSALDYKHDGLITGLGSNYFKLAGSVILYAIVSGFFMGILKVVLNVWI